MHPLYFLEKVHDDEGLPESLDDDKKHLPKEALDLIEVQDKVMDLQCMQPDTGRGIYNNAPLGSTFCNHAVFITVMAVDGNYKNFTNRTAKDDAGFPEYNNLTQRKNKNIELKRHCTKDKCDFYYHKISNYWCDILAEASRNESTGIKEVNLEQAQKLANQGFVVIVCHKNLAFRYGAPHFATIRPYYNITTYATDIVKVANVGKSVGVSSVADAFNGSVKYFYN